jgi:peptidoglycan/xylan/chitin deacetylase (PgdA/CDA1 family)
MYHDVVPAGAEDTSGFPGRDAALYKVTPALFDAHLRAILAATNRACPARPASSAPPAPPALPARPALPAPVFTFDDGGASALRAADALDRCGFRGHFFITTNYIGTRGFVDWRDLRDLYERGHMIGSHSCTHPLRMGHCSWSQLLDEWTRSAAILANILGVAVTTGSLPGGDFAPQVAEAAAEAGFKDLFTSEPTRDDRHAFGLTLHGRFAIQRWTTAGVAAALAAGEWLPAARQAALWNAKKLGKRLGGERYLALRRLLLGIGH